MATALAGLAVLIVALGPAISVIPLRELRLVVGGLLLVFGLQWLRKSVLRASGYKALHDEDAIFREQVVAAGDGVPGRPRGGIADWYAFTLSFKGVLLEGLEVVFIVLTFGSNQHDIELAALAAAPAVVVVVLAGVAVRAPLARVPENSLKFVVGVLLSAFGTFWGAEGAGATWPGGDAALLVLAPAIALLRSGVDRRASTRACRSASRPCFGLARDDIMITRLKAFGAFWYDFVVGDDWRVAVGAAVALALTYVVSRTDFSVLVDRSGRSRRPAAVESVASDPTPMT